MSQFTSPCIVEIVGPMLFRIVEPFEYHIGKYPSRKVITVPEDFVTDFASIPRVFWPILSPLDEYAKAAVLHDYMYVMGPYERLRCEEIFLEAMTVLGVPEWKKKCVYRAVYLCGWHRWNYYRKQENSLEENMKRR